MANLKAKNILSLIEADHQKVERLFAEFETASGAKAHTGFNQIYTELTLHARAEELVFYPALQEHEATRPYIEEAEQEHNAAKILLEQMKALNPQDQEFKTKMMHLKESVVHHVQEEESEIFDAVRKCIDEQALQELGQEFEAAKAQLKPDVELALTL
jgi:hemerythrin superfamily protein